MFNHDPQTHLHEFGNRNGLHSKIYTREIKGSDRKGWTDIAPTGWYRNAQPGTDLMLNTHSPRIAYFLIVSSDQPYPVKLFTDPSNEGPFRLVVPGSEEAAELSRHPYNLCCVRPSLQADVRHEEEEVTGATAAPSTAEDGVGVTDMETVEITFDMPAGGPNTAVVWGYDRGVWVPIPGFDAVSVSSPGTRISVPTNGFQRVDVQTSVFAANMSFFYPFSRRVGQEEVIANVIIQAWWPAPFQPAR